MTTPAEKPTSNRLKRFGALPSAPAGDEPALTEAPTAQVTPPELLPELMFSDLSERTLLGVAFDEGRRALLGQILGVLSPEDFYAPHHADAWRCIAHLHELSLPTDVAAVLDRARSSNLWLGGIEYITGLIEDPTVIAGISDEAALKAGERIKNFSTRRRLREALTRGLSLCNTSELPVDDILSNIEDELADLQKRNQSASTGPVHIRAIVSDVMERMQLQMDGDIAPPVPTGFTRVDSMIHGLEDEQLIIVAARPSMGKTAFLKDLANNGADRGRPALIFSLEMTKGQLGARFLSSVARVDADSIRRADIADSDWSRLAEGMDNLANKPIWIDDQSGLTLPEIRARARAFVAKHGKATILVDYLQFIAQSEKAGRSEQERKDHAATTSRGLKLLARELKCPVVALAQLNRSLEQRANKRPMMSDLRESGQIEQDADVIMFLYRDEYYNPDTKEPGITEVIVGKQRDGAVGTAKVQFEKRLGSFENIDY